MLYQLGAGYSVVHNKPIQDVQMNKLYVKDRYLKCRMTHILDHCSYEGGSALSGYWASCLEIQRPVLTTR